MSLDFLKNIDRLFRYFAILIFLGMTAYLTNLEVRDLDIWLHLASGKYILQHKVVPQVDFLSCTVVGKPWINHEWLFQVLIAFIYQIWGTDGWIFTQGILIGAILMGVLLLCWSQEINVVLVWFVFLVLQAFDIRIVLRPDIFSLLFYIIYLHVIFKFLRNKNSPWFLFFLQILWTNIHGFFIFGPLTLMIILGAETVVRRLKLGKTSLFNELDYDQLKKSCFLTSAACFMSPSFIHGALYPIQILLSTHANGTFFKSISELQKPIVWGNILAENSYWPYKLLIVLSGISFVLNRKRCSVTLFILWFLMLLFSLNAVRNILFFCVTAVFIITINLRQFLPRNVLYARWFDTPQWYIASIVIQLLMIVNMKGYFDEKFLRGYFDFDHYERKSEFGGVSLRNYPYRAADFLVREGIKGNFFNDFNSGAYLLGRTFPNIKVFIDGRTEVYGTEFFNKYDSMMHGQKEIFDQAVQRFNLTGVFLNSVYVPAPASFTNIVFQSREWKLIYFDYDGMIFLRDIPENKTWIDPLTIDLENRQVPKAELTKFGVHPIDPYQYYRRAQVLFNLKLFDQAEQELIQALRISPVDADSYLLLSKIYSLENKHELSFEYARKAKILNPDDYEAKFYIARSAFYLGSLELAEKQCDKVLAMKSTHIKSLLLKAQIYAKEGKDQQSMELLRKAVDSEKGENEDDLRSALDFFIQNGKLKSAQDMYQWLIDQKNEKQRHEEIIKDYKNLLNRI